ncbi:hypothetical protein Pse7367_0912 [Thalassoporum mexicanum PCC 7367]|uniref:hypothetical protein n=1 Tax=Thalassoporum mexicanum TaxID=3457544 RepID=UPI00029FE8D1|nr:hypothetical protein [Pseudanabaena sp. PCC 7367]AFY69212.1 hypothetical protein Pse7367_0912 [Pseudanabaena sp. PCC 7367]
MIKKLIILTMPIALIFGMYSVSASSQANSSTSTLAQAEQPSELEQNTSPDPTSSDLDDIDPSDSVPPATPSEFPTSPEPLELPESSELSDTPDTPDTSDASAEADYAVVDLNSLPAAVEQNGADPEAIAVALFGNTEPTEGNFEEEIDSQIVDDQAVVTITQLGLADDSVRGVRYMLKFDQMDDQTWQLVWVGVQQTCYEGRGTQEWTTDACV